MAAAPISSLLNQEFPKVVFSDHYYLRIIYMNGIPNAFANSGLLFFADDVKYFKNIKVPSDMQLLQHHLDSLSDWSITSLLSFNPSKRIHLSFKFKV